MGGVPVLEVELFGAVRAQRGADPVPRSSLSLLAFLVLRRPRQHPRTVVAATLCPDTDEWKARRRFNTALWRLRRWLEPDENLRGRYILASASYVGLNPDASLDSDVQRFESTIAPVVNAPGRLSPAQLAQLELGVGLYRGELLEGSYDDWVLYDRNRLADLHLAALYRLIRAHRAGGNTEKVATFGDLALEQEPLREDIHRELISAYAEAGQRERALGQFERCRRLLREGLDVDPMPETLTLVTGLSTMGGVPTVAAPWPDVAEVTRHLLAVRRQLVDLAEVIDRSVVALAQQTNPHQP